MRKITAILAGAAALTAATGAATLALAFDDPPPPTSILGADRSHAREIFATKCASCHENPSSDRVPSRAAISAGGPDNLVRALTEGPMKPMAAGLSPAEIDQLALFVTGKPPLPKLADGPEPNQCAKADPIRITANSWNGWSPDQVNTRYQPNPGLKPDDVKRLKVKWTFAYPGSKNSQVTVIGDRLFFGSNAGKVYSLNAKTGCVYWRYDAKGGMRAAPVVVPLAASPSGNAVIITDDTLSVNALDALTGKQIWRTKVETHPRAQMTGAPKFYNGVLYVPIASAEEIATNEPDYTCCTFQGVIVAVDAKTGKKLWETRSTSIKPHAFQGAGGKQLMGPAGGAIWSSPTIDAKRGVLYVATGDSYTDIDHPGSDAVIAMDLKSGAVKWTNQLTAKDNFMVGCPQSGKIPANCPTPLGPDVDFGSSVILKSVAGKDILLAGQKSGVAWGIDPDTGKTLWSNKLGRGGAAGGVEWGMAADAANLYVAIADPGAGGQPGLNAVKIMSGDIVWKTPTPALPCPQGRRCVVSQSAPVTAIPGVVFSGAVDGHLRAYDVKDGKIIWDFDTTAGTYDTVNGKTGMKGGAIDATGPTIVNGMLFQHSGYPGVMMGPGGQNLLMA
ncbi:MAG TPA: PQQ-binding-like beta-propeller repeat protein, partial [Caulobacteraceae bacterium]|nr:PQQ-binding-like beta-propeller repeat protein [Caulobacteraceae bacterium]